MPSGWLCTRYVWTRSFPLARKFGLYTSGPLRERSVLGDHEQGGRDTGNHERRTAAETGGNGEPWVYGRAVGDRWTMLVSRCRCTTGCEDRAVPSEPCNMVLGKEAIGVTVDFREIRSRAALGDIVIRHSRRFRWRGEQLGGWILPISLNTEPALILNGEATIVLSRAW